MIPEVSATLVAAIGTAAPDLAGSVVQSSLSQADPAPAANRIAVCLYAVEQHPHLINRPLESTPDGYIRPPLALRLHYLITYTGTHEESQIRLARVIQVFHSTPILGPTALSPALAAVAESVTVRLRTTTPDERNQIWGALGRPARFALFYEVDVAPVAVLKSDGHGRIEQHRIDYVGVS